MTLEDESRQVLVSNSVVAKISCQKSIHGSKDFHFTHNAIKST